MTRVSHISVYQKVRRWFYNHSDPPHRQTIRFIQKWSARNVFYHAKKEDIMTCAQDVSGGAPGSQAFLGALQDAITHFWNELSIEEVEIYEDMAKDWSENTPPEHIQSRQVISQYAMYQLTPRRHVRMASAVIQCQIVRDFQTQLY
jgi:hypothetical protein